MARLAMTHSGVSSTLPPRELLEPLIERTPLHWFWLGDFTTDGLDEWPVFSWGAPERKPARFAVPRLLWQLDNPDAASRVVLENTCGLFTCVNPAHLRRRHAGAWPRRIALVPGSDVRAVATPAFPDAAHVWRRDAEAAVCGKALLNRQARDDGVVTCEDCIASWCGRGHPFVEVS